MLDEMKNVSINDSESANVKLMLNSLYGKFGSKRQLKSTGLMERYEAKQEELERLCQLQNLILDQMYDVRTEMDVIRSELERG